MITYSVFITVKDAEGLQLQATDGSKRSDMIVEVRLNEGGEESYLRQTAKTIGVWAPNRRIRLGLYTRNNIAGTFVNTHALLPDGRFVQYS